MTRLATVAVGASITAAIENADRAAINKTEQLVTPTSVANGTIGTYGAVTFSAASSVSLNGVFTSEFDWYRVDFFATTSGAANIGVNLRLSGTDAVTAYDRINQRGLNVTNTVATSLNQTTWPVTITTVTGFHLGSLRLFNPALASPTVVVGLTGSTANPMTTADGAAYNMTLQHRTATAYDGITLTPSTGTFTGTVRVYGII
jgi:hypothetical protein